MGLLQATEALKLLLGIGETSSAGCSSTTALDGTFQELHLRRDPACPACGDAARAALGRPAAAVAASVGGTGMSTVRIPPVLRASAGDQKQLSVDGATVGAVLEALVAMHPALRGQLLSADGELHRFVNVYLNDQDVRYLDALATPVTERDTIIDPARDGRRCLSPRSAGADAGGGRGPRASTRSRRPSGTRRWWSCPPCRRAPACGCWPSWRASTRADRSRTASRGPSWRTSSRPAASGRARRSWRRPAATPASPWPCWRGATATRSTVVLPDNVTQERRQLLTLYGAEIIESPGPLGSNGAIALARRLAAQDDRYVMADQYANAANPRAHYETTGPEILAACPEVDVFVAGLGTGGTLMGVGRRPARDQPGRAPHRRRAAARRAGPGPAVAGRRLRARDPGHRRCSTAASWSRARDAIRGLRALLEREGILGGVSSGAVLVAARRVAETMERGTLVLLLADGGWKYLSDGLWTRDLAELEADAETRNWW